MALQLNPRLFSKTVERTTREVPIASEMLRFITPFVMTSAKYVSFINRSLKVNQPNWTTVQFRLLSFLLSIPQIQSQSSTKKDIAEHLAQGIFQYLFTESGIVAHSSAPGE